MHWRLGWRITSRATIGPLSESLLDCRAMLGRNDGFCQCPRYGNREVLTRADNHFTVCDETDVTVSEEARTHSVRVWRYLLSPTVGAGIRKAYWIHQSTTEKVSTFKFRLYYSNPISTRAGADYSSKVLLTLGNLLETSTGSTLPFRRLRHKYFLMATSPGPDSFV